MSNGISLEFIDDNFPQPGKDNPSQGFRDNFQSIALNFQGLNDQLADLQTNAARTDANSNFNANTISNVNLSASTFAAYAVGNIDTSTEIDFFNGQFQLVTVTDTLTLTLINWPSAERYSFIRIALRSDGNSRTVYFGAKDNQVIKYDATWPENVIIASENNWTIVEFFSFDGGKEIFASYKGPYQEEKITTDFFDDIQINSDAVVDGNLEVKGSLIYSDLQVAEGVDFVVNTDAVVEGTLSANSITVNDTITGSIQSLDESPVDISDLNVNGEFSVNNNTVVKTAYSSSLGIGAESLTNLTTGEGNFAVGNNSLRLLTTGNNNTVAGKNSGESLVAGSNNLVLGNMADVSDSSAENEITLGNDLINRFRIPGLNIDVTPTGGIKTPAGTTDERPSGTLGTIRFNTDKEIFEGYDGETWVGLGSIVDQDQDTFLKTETAPGSDEDTFYFTTGSSVAATLDRTQLELQSGVQLKVLSTDSVTAADTGALTVAGGASIDGDLLVTGEIINNDTTRESSVSASATCSVDEQTNTLTITSDADKFKAENQIRVFGASSDDTALTEEGLSLAVDRVGFVEPSSSDTLVTFSYQIAQFDFTTGKISSALNPVAVDIKADDITDFSSLNNIQLTMSRKSSDTGLLIYRKAGSQTSHRLVAVLGAKDFGGSTANLPWTDYYNFDLPDWANKDDTNAFNNQSGIEHFPLNPPASPSLGWIDTTITDIDTTTGSVTVEDSFFGEQNLTVYRDDTKDLQTLIDINQSLNIKRLQLQTRNYFVTRLTIPPEFTIAGGGNNTVITKMPWSGDNDSRSNVIIKVQDQSSDAKGFSLESLKINGNAQNQYVLDDSVDPDLNYAVKIYGKGIDVQDVVLENVIGGGFYLYNTDIATSNVFFNRNIVRRGSLTLRYDYSPLIAQEATDINCTQNKFTSFTQYVDVNAVLRGVISHNIIYDCSSGLFGFGVISTILNPNVLVGAGGELISGPNVLNSEFDSVNITLEPDVDYVSPAVVYQESGEAFDLTANQGERSYAINELRKINGVEVISRDFSETTAGEPYISFDQSVDASQGQIQFRIQSALVNDLLSRADYETLYENNQNTLGLIYRLFQTEYVPQTDIIGTGSDQGSNIYRLPVENASEFSTNDVVRLVNHNTSPTTAGEDGTVVSVNTITNQIDIEFDFTITSPGDAGSVALKNTFVVVKGKIN